MGTHTCECHRPSRQRAANQGQARQPLPLHHHPGGEGEVHHRAGGEGGDAPVERGVLLRAAPRDPGGWWSERIPPRERGPGPDGHAPGAYRTGRVSRSNHHSS